MLNELQAAIEDLKEKQIIWNIANEEYEPTAYYNMKAAEERVNAIIRNMKGSVTNDEYPISRQAI